jgi:LuxR family transcriptional regulator, maltose regulon positive regulatory protein
MAERCLHAIAEGLRAAERADDRLTESVLVQIGAAMSLNCGDVAAADRFLTAFERLAETLPDVPVDRSAYYAVSGWRKLQGGECALALELLRRALAISEARGTAYHVAVDHLGLGLLLHLCGESHEAIGHLETARAIGAEIRNLLIEFAYRLFAAYVALSSGDEANARGHLEAGMALGRQKGYMHFFFFPPRVIARVCLAALEAGIETAYVRALIERNGITPDPTWRHAESWPWPLRVYTLGRFGIVRRGSALRFEGKTQKKPLDLLKAIIAFGGREVPESRLSDALWPDAEGDAAAQALATTLFRLRKLIGEQAIRRQEGRLTLDPNFCWVDCWAFERLSSDSSGDAAARREKLGKLHQGAFLEGDDDAPWAQPMRQRLRAKLSRTVGT